MKLRLEKFSYRFAEQVLNSKLAIKQEVESLLTDSSISIPTLSRRNFNAVLRELFVTKGWDYQPSVFSKPSPALKMDFLKERVGIEVGFSHASFIGIDLLKFQVSSALDRIDLGIYILATRQFQKVLITEFKQKWIGSLTYDQVVKYLPHFKSAIQVPIYVIGIDL